MAQRVPAKSLPIAAATALPEPARASLAPRPPLALGDVHFVGFKAGELLDYLVQSLHMTQARIDHTAALPLTG